MSQILIKPTKNIQSLQQAQINKQQNKLHTLRKLDQIKANITKKTPSSQLKLKANSLAAPPLEQTEILHLPHNTMLQREFQTPLQLKALCLTSFLINQKIPSR